MEQGILFYIIDDDDTVLITLESIIRRVFTDARVIKESNGLDAWEFIQKHKKPMVVVSDINIPGINGLLLLSKVRADAECNQVYMIIMTSTNDKEINLNVIKKGADDFIAKPFSVDYLIAQLRNAARMVNQYMLMNTEKNNYAILLKELTDNSFKLKDLIVNIQHNRIIDSEKILKPVLESGLWLLNVLDTSSKINRDSFIAAAEMAYIGKLYLPDRNLNEPVMINGQPKGEVMEQVPVHAFNLLNNFRVFKESALILYHLYENFDGSGIPKKIKGWQIPLGSRILRVTLDFEEMQVKQKMSVGKAMDALDHESKRVYDFNIVAFLDQYNAINGIGSSYKEKRIEKKELEPRMMVSRNIITEAGMKVVAAGTQLTEEKIETLRKMTKSDPIIGNIYIRV